MLHAHPEESANISWYGDWQDQRHAVVFDGRSRLDRRNLLRNYEGFNDVRLLNERIDQGARLSLLEVGCATGEFFRYLRSKHPTVRYYGIDISEPAVARARAKYPDAPFFVTEPGARLGSLLPRLGVPEHPEVVYAKDVLQHQTEPLEFLSDLVRAASDTVILRCRTRDVGATVWDPDQSCQYHYGGWMPYIVLNLEELTAHILNTLPASEIVIYRNHMVLGGQHNRFVPKELYYPDTGTAESAVGIFKRTAQPGTVVIRNRVDQNPSFTWDYLLKHAARQMVDSFKVATGTQADR